VCGFVGRVVKSGRERELWRCFVGGDGFVCGFDCVVAVGDVLDPVPFVAALLKAERTTLA